MRESRRCTSEAESTGGDTGPLEFPAWSRDDQEALTNSATMTVPAKIRVDLRGIMGDIRVVGERRKYANNIHGNFE
jgi:hypothetical protein